MNDYCERQRTKFQNSKNGKRSNKTQRQDTSTSTTSPTQTRVLVIGDSMVKNIDNSKPERAASGKTICHSYMERPWGKSKKKSKSIGMKMNIMKTHLTCWDQRSGTFKTKLSC